MVASLVGMAQQPGISSAVGEPVEPTNKLWEKKNVSRSKKSQHFLRKPLDTLHSFGMLNEFFCEKLGEPLDT